MRTYASSRVKRKSFYRKSKLQMFLLISGGHIGAPKRRTNMASSYKAPTKVRETFRPITQKLWATKTLVLDKLFIYLIVLYNISFSWLKGNKREETFREHYTANLTAGSVIRCQIKNGGCCGQKKTRFKRSTRGKWLAENNSIVSAHTLVLPKHNSVVVWS